MSRTMPMDCPGCGKVLDWGDFGPSGNDPDQAKLDKPQCTCFVWVWRDGWVIADTPESAAETLPNVQACYPLCACVKCSTEAAEPNPYRCTVSVHHCFEVYDLRLNIDDLGPLLVGDFPTKEEADTHAALILAALHQAVME